MAGLSGPTGPLDNMAAFLKINTKTAIPKSSIGEQITIPSVHEARTRDQLAGLGRAVAKMTIAAAASPLVVPFVLGFVFVRTALVLTRPNLQEFDPKFEKQQLSAIKQDFALSKALFQSVGSTIVEAMSSKESVASVEVPQTFNEEAIQSLGELIGKIDANHQLKFENNTFSIVEGTEKNPQAIDEMLKIAEALKGKNMKLSQQLAGAFVQKRSLLEESSQVRVLNMVGKELLNAEAGKFSANVLSQLSANQRLKITPETREKLSLAQYNALITQPKTKASENELGGELCSKTNKATVKNNDVDAVLSALDAEVSRKSYVTGYDVPKEAVGCMADMFTVLGAERQQGSQFCYSTSPRVVGDNHTFRLLDEIDNKKHSNKAITFAVLPKQESDESFAYELSVEQIKGLMKSVEVEVIGDKPETTNHLKEISVKGLTAENQPSGNRFLTYVDLHPPLRGTGNTFEQVKEGAACKGALVNIAGRDLRIQSVRKQSLDCDDSGNVKITMKDDKPSASITADYEQFIQDQVQAVVAKAEKHKHKTIVFPGIGIGAFVTSMEGIPKSVILADGATVSIDEKAVKNDLRVQIAERYLAALQQELQGKGITVIVTDDAMKSQIGNFSIPIVATDHSAIDAQKILMKKERMNPLIVNAGDQNGVAGYQLALKATKALDGEDITPPHYALDEALFADFPVAAAVLQHQQKKIIAEW